MKTALLTAVALTALATTHVLAQSPAPATPGAQSQTGEGAGGCPCCQKMKKADHGSMSMPGAPSAPTDTPRR